CCLAPQTIGLTFGASYGPAAPVLAILVWAQLSWTTYVFVTAGLIAVGRQRTCASLSAAVLAVTLVLGLGLIPHWGAIGAALATTLASLTTVAWMLFHPVWRAYLRAMLHCLKLL